MKPSEALTAHRDELRQLVSHYGLSRPRVFGSIVSATDTDESDLDLLVDPGQSTSLLTIAGLPERVPLPDFQASEKSQQAQGAVVLSLLLRETHSEAYG